MDNIKHQILSYSMETIKNKGIKALTLKSIAQNCHISRTTFYQYFQSKQALIDEIHELNSEYDVHTTKERILLAAIDVFINMVYSELKAV